ncbi:c-type cytochrome [Tsuneonella sp. SYSU-LHT278]|uniref:c-type cytochrome n=1 Tax=Tsuneonella sediminis TaxID=3416089 RepID=UPI003F792595
MVLSPVPVRMGQTAFRDQIAARAATVLALSSCLALAGCKDPSGTRYEPAAAAKERGLAAIHEAGCGACHEIPGIDWPAGKLGPSLKGFDDTGLIAGRLPNRPAVLAAFIRDAPSVIPGSTMPPIPVTRREAADIASYLYGLDDD